MATRKPNAGRIIAVGAGKGGVGKSVVSANLSLLLAQRGHRVLAVDADLGGANLHTVLGIKPPARGLSDVINSEATLDEVAVQTTHPNLRLVSGAFDDAHAANPHYQQKLRVLRHLGAYDADFVLLDLGAGTSLNTLDFFLFADYGILVVLPEPTSVENAYRFLKAGYLRRLRNVTRAFGLRPVVEAAKRHRNALGIKTPADLMRVLYERDPELGQQVEEQMRSFQPFLILNQTRHTPQFDDRTVAKDMVSACRRFFGVELRELACIPHDDAVAAAIRQRLPVTLGHPSSEASRALSDLATKFLRIDGVREAAA